MRESLLIAFEIDKKNEKKDKINRSPDDIEEILDEIQEIKEEMPENTEKDIIEEEIVPINYDHHIQTKVTSSKRNIKVIKARPISANIKAIETYPNETKNLNKDISLVNLDKKDEKNSNLISSTNPFKSMNRPKTEFASKRKDIIRKEDFEIYDNVGKNSPLKEKGIENLLKKIEQLDDDKKYELEKFLERILDGKLDIKSLLKFEFNPNLEQKASLNFNQQFTNKVEILPRKSITESIIKKDIDEQTNNNIEFIPEEKNLLKIRVISTWGSIHHAGLTEIQLFSSNGEKIPLSFNDIQIKNTSFPNLKQLKNIINGVYLTIDEENMWFATMPAPPKCMEILIFFPKIYELSAILLWNYNKSLIESIKGIKEIEVFLNNIFLSMGVVKKGVGNEYDDYKEFIRIKDNFEFVEKTKKENFGENKSKMMEKIDSNNNQIKSINKSTNHPKTFPLFEEITNEELRKTNESLISQNKNDLPKIKKQICPSPEKNQTRLDSENDNSKINLNIIHKPNIPDISFKSVHADEKNKIIEKVILNEQELKEKDQNPSLIKDKKTKISNEKFTIKKISNVKPPNEVNIIEEKNEKNIKEKTKSIDKLEKKKKKQRKFNSQIRENNFLR